MNFHKIIIIVGILTLSFYSCVSDQIRYHRIFDSHYDKLKLASEYISDDIRKYRHKAKNVLVFVNEPQYSPNQNYIFDKYLSGLMNEAGIEQIVCYINPNNNCGAFEEITFQLAEDVPKSKAIYFIYNGCDNIKEFEGNLISQKRIRPNWFLLIDKN